MDLMKLGPKYKKYGINFHNESLFYGRSACQPAVLFVSVCPYVSVPIRLCLLSAQTHTDKHTSIGNYACLKKSFLLIPNVHTLVPSLCRLGIQHFNLPMTFWMDKTSQSFCHSVFRYLNAVQLNRFSKN